MKKRNLFELSLKERKYIAYNIVISNERTKGIVLWLSHKGEC